LTATGSGGWATMLPVHSKAGSGPLNDAPAVGPCHGGRRADHLRLLLPRSAKTWMPTFVGMTVLRRLAIGVTVGTGSPSA
jgi:hypothetical protein